MLGRHTLPFFFLSYFTETPNNTGMPHVNGPSTEPFHHASYNNAIQLDDDIASSSHASHNLDVSDDQNTYDAIDDLLPGQNHNYDYVLQRHAQNEDIKMSDIRSVSTKPVNHGSYNNAIQHHDELSGSNQACDNRSVKDDQAAYEVPVDIFSSDQNHNYDNVILRDEHYEKRTDETHYQPLKFNREILYQDLELYEKTVWL